MCCCGSLFNSSYLVFVEHLYIHCSHQIWGFHSVFLQIFSVSVSLLFGIPTMCILICLMVFHRFLRFLICISLIIIDVEHLFISPLGHLYVFFLKTVQFLCPFLNHDVSFFAVELYKILHILDINPLVVILFANIFSHSVGCLFIFYQLFPFCSAEAF